MGAWNALSSEEKKKWEDKRCELVQEYEKKIKAFYDSPLYKRATKVIAKASNSAAKLAGMPKKPPNAVLLYLMDKKLKPAEAAKAWQEAPAEEKEKYGKQAA